MAGMEKMKTISELVVKRWFVKCWRDWALVVYTYEPNAGGTVGVADLQISHNGRLVPIELKVGDFRKGKLLIHMIRPAQVHFHEELERERIFSCFLVAVGSGSTVERLFAFDGYRAKEYLGRVDPSWLKEIDPKDMVNQLREYLDKFIPKN